MYNHLKQKTDSQLRTDAHKEVIKKAKRKARRDLRERGLEKRKIPPTYKTLKVVPRSKRTPENSNSCGVAV